MISPHYLKKRILTRESIGVMRRLIFLSMIAWATVSSCRYSAPVYQSDRVYGVTCPAPVYVATMAFSAKQETTTNFGNKIIAIDEGSLTMVALLAMAKEKYGDDVMIDNLRWDMKSRKHPSGVIFDVLRCK